VTLIAIAGLARIELNSRDIPVGSTLVSYERTKNKSYNYRDDSIETLTSPPVA